MAIDFTGIINEHEFYTNHYLTAIIESDLKDLFSKWSDREKEEGVKPPYNLLKALAKDYFGVKDRLTRERVQKDRLKLQRDFAGKFLEVLGYDLEPVVREVDCGAFIPLLGEVKKSNGAPDMWIIEAVDESGESIDPLNLNLVKYQYPDGVETEDAILESPLEDVVSKHIFGRSEPPRWILLLSDTQAVLLDRSKWNEKRLLRFDLPEIFGRRETSTAQAVSALLHSDSICPVDGISLLDTLDENSHKHAFSVSDDLKYAVREAIELIGNEAVLYHREVLKRKIFELELKDDKYEEKDLAGQLTKECLRYMYRLLFLFYIEARPELGYAPMKAEVYRKGYSLEFLRDLEMVKLTNDESRNGYYISESLDMLFNLVYNGFRADKRAEERELDFGENLPQHHTFEIPALRSHLFDPEKTPLLNSVKFRNSVLQRVLELMSLSKPKNRNDRRGRISYAQLGINQLGAVYEALLSYKGFFADADLYEVKKENETPTELDTAYFITKEDIEKYDEDEKVFKDDGTLKIYPKGTFIYRLAGRNRESSASYYTPEVLTKCLVKYALKELLKDKTADEILHLTVCEPAMGSAAFINEAVNQLSEAYLQKKQKETGINIPHDQYGNIRQQVRMFIADNNVFGVDLNPVAVELAEVSIWLNSIYGGGYIPWFGNQLVCGNSLVGARRQVFDVELLRKNDNTGTLWLDEIPERVMPGKGRPENGIYHFLLPDKGMANYTDKVVKNMAKNEIDTIKNWRNDFCKEFKDHEIEMLKRLSSAVDVLWARHIREQRRVRKLTTDPLQVWGQPEPDKDLKMSSIRQKDEIFDRDILSKGRPDSTPYLRLKTAMDYWCSLWFWHIEKAELLPSRYEFLLEMTMLLEGSVIELENGETKQLSWLPDEKPEQLKLDMTGKHGFVNIDELCSKSPRLAEVRNLAEQYRFHHWELEFADIFREKGGFDLIVGNPPWIKVEWNESGVMGDRDPLYVIRKFSASEMAKLRNKVIERYNLKGDYLSAAESAEGTQNFLNAYQNYPHLRGMQTNLYKCFLPQAWMVGSSKGISAFLHPEGNYDDPKGGGFRREVYPRLRYHFQFHNEMILFSDVHHATVFSINIYKNNKSSKIGFFHIANLYSPSSVDICVEHNGDGSVPGIKDDDNKWNTAGHKDRIIAVGQDELELFAKLYDAEGTPYLEARLPNAHSVQVVEVLKKIAGCEKRLGDLKNDYYSTVMFDETYSQRDGLIKRDTKFPEKVEEWILSGPHFYVGVPLYKTPRRICSLNSHYDVIDLTEIPEDYLPRTNFKPACEYHEYGKACSSSQVESGTKFAFSLLCK